MDWKTYNAIAYTTSFPFKSLQLRHSKKINVRCTQYDETNIDKIKSSELFI